MKMKRNKERTELGLPTKRREKNSKGAVSAQLSRGGGGEKQQITEECRQVSENKGKIWTRTTQHSTAELQPSYFIFIFLSK